jgi:hypothetical protein
MSKYALIEDNIVRNVVEADFAPSSNYVLANENAGIGDTYDPETGTFTVIPYQDDYLSSNLEQSSRILSESDWTVLPDVGLTDANVQEWKTYRATIRAIRKNPSSTQDDNFPDKPDIIYS